MIAKAFRFAKAFQHMALKSLRGRNSLRDHAGRAFFYVMKYRAGTARKPRSRESDRLNSGRLRASGLGAAEAVENFGVCLDLGSSV